jgi:hypothetical protein
MPVGSKVVIRSEDQQPGNVKKPTSSSGGKFAVGTLKNRTLDGTMEMGFCLDGPKGFSTSSSDADETCRFLYDAAAVPLPPYIDAENARKVSAESYQTVYAREDGSLAAPTAGLHFTEDVFRRLTEKGIRREEITLHVGYGTFGHVVVSTFFVFSIATLKDIIHF